MAPLFRPLTSFFAVVMALVVLLTSMPRAAWAQTVPSDASLPAGTPDEDKRHGDEAMIALRYQEALAYYRRAFDATKNPALLYNMGRAYEGLAEFPKALDALDEFTDKAPPELKARVPKLEELVNDVRRRVATMVVSVPVAGAEIRLGNKVLGSSKPGPNVYRVNAGPQTLQVSHRDYFPFERTLILVGGQSETIDVVLALRSAEALLRVTSPVSGAAVAIDGKSIGNVPAETPMKPGQHRIAVSRDGYDSAEANVVLAAGERKDVDIPMAVHDSIAKKWWFWTGIGVVLVAGGIATYIALTTEKDPSAGTIPPGTVKAQSWGFRF